MKPCCSALLSAYECNADLKWQIVKKERERKENFEELQTLPVVKCVIIPWLDELLIISEIEGLMERFMGMIWQFLEI